MVETPSADHSSGCAESRIIEVRIIFLIENMQNRVLIQIQVPLMRLNAGAQSFAKVLTQRRHALENSPYVYARALRIFHRLAPHRLALDERVAQRLSLQAGVLGEERVTMGEVGDGAQKSAFGRRKKGHVYIHCTCAYIECTIHHPVRSS